MKHLLLLAVLVAAVPVGAQEWPNRPVCIVVRLGQPVVVENRLPGFEALAWFGIGAPRTRAAIAEKVASSVKEVLAIPEVVKRLNELSAEPMGLTPA